MSLYFGEHLQPCTCSKLIKIIHLCTHEQQDDWRPPQCALLIKRSTFKRSRVCASLDARSCICAFAICSAYALRFIRSCFFFSARHNKNELVEPWMLFPLDETAGRLLMWWWTQQAKKLVHSILFFILVSLNQTRTAAGGRFMESLQYRPTRKSPYETSSAFLCKTCFTFVIVRSACNTFTTGYAANSGTRPRSLLAQLDMLHVVVQ